MSLSSDRFTRVVVIAGVFSGLFVAPSSVAFAAAAQDQVIVESPLRIIEGQRGDIVTRLVLDPDGYSAIKSREAVLLTGFVLDQATQVNLELSRIEVFAEDARIVCGTPLADEPLARPDVVLLGGQVAGRPDSSVFLGLSPHGCNGFIRLADETFIISSGSQAGNEDTVVYGLTTLPPGTINWAEHVCRSDELPIPAGFQPVPDEAGSERATQRDANCRIADLAIETDWEYTGNLFGGDTEAAGAYVATLVGALSGIYTRDFNVRVQISYLRLWSSSSDPWDQGDTTQQLYQFQDHWNANMTHVNRHAVHFLSGRGLGGGVAYGGGLCYPDYDYGLSADLNGYFPSPVQHNHEQNWDPFVMSHELGHNFGAPHTHDMSPPIDECAFGDCSVTPNGTIMSYCHGCPGGMTNIRMEFHTRMINEEVLPFLDNEAQCDLTAEAPTITEQPSDQSVTAGNPVTFAVSASGVEPLSYQWRKDGGGIDGATSDSYTIDSVTPADAGDYDVVVDNTCGSQTSDIATLTVVSSVLGDLDGDGDVDLSDFNTFAVCFTGSGGPVAPGCEDADLDSDNDVDLSDFNTFAVNFTGSGG